MANKKRTVFETWSDRLLLLGIALLIGYTAWLVSSSPLLWAWCLWTMDMRNWSYGVWGGVIAALLVVLLAIRFCPRKKKPHQEVLENVPIP